MSTRIYTLSLHDALPILAVPSFVSGAMAKAGKGLLEGTLQAGTSATYLQRSEERFSRNAETDLVCRLLLEKKNIFSSAFFTRSNATPPPGTMPISTTPRL